MGFKPSHRVSSARVDALIERKQPDLPAFAVIPAPRVAAWKLTTTTTIEGTIDGAALGRRSLHRWDDERFFIELPRPLLEAIGKEPGDRATLVLTLASTELPAELTNLLASVPEARARWESQSAAQKRMLREAILSAKSPATRERRARRALLGAATPRQAGGCAAPRRIVVRIIGRELPGRSCGPYTDVSVGLVQKVGRDPEDVVSADAREAAWETALEVRERDGSLVFRGPAAHGPVNERFFYLTWLGRKDGDDVAMFRRAKLRLDAIPAEVVARALESGVLIGEVGLTACDGMPLCASVRPPTIAWSA